MKKIRLIQIFYWTFITAMVILAGTLLLSMYKGPYGLRLLVVYSGSMEPAIKTGSIVVVVPAEKYRENDVITFSNNPKANLKDVKNTTTHRVVSVEEVAGQTIFLTKGDANPSGDRGQVAASSVLGKVIMSVPRLGFLISFAKTQLGLIVFLIIPGTIIVYSEVIKIRHEVESLIVKRVRQKDRRIMHGFRKLVFSLVVLSTVIVAFPKAVSLATDFIDYEKSKVKLTIGTWSSPVLDFFLAPDKRSVGFTLRSIADYDKLNYSITYQADGLPKGIGPGEINIDPDMDMISRDGLTLGTCSEGGVCVYDANISPLIHIKVTLTGTGLTEKILEKEIPY